MKSFSIVLKLFLIFTIIFSLFISVFLLGQTLFFKKFYIDTKTSNLEKNLKQFSLLYSKDSWNKDDIIRYMNKFADENNTQIAILDNFGAAKYTPDFNITLETSNKDRVKIPLNNIAHLNDFQNLKLAIGSNLEVKIYIENQGEHIKEEDLSKIWYRFYRAEKSREKKTGGTGLGLSIVKNILELHESKFGAKNTEKGVRFYFTLRIK